MQNYHKHTCASNIYTPDSAAFLEEYAKRAIEVGHGILSTVEHGWQGKYHQAYEVAKKHDLKLIFGAEAYWVKDQKEKDKTNAHIILLAKNENGRRKINKILSDAGDFGYYYKPRVDEKSILELPPNDVFVTSACIGFWQYEDEYMEEFVKKLSNHFKSNFMLEIQYHKGEEQKRLNEKILELSKRYSIPMIVGMDSHYINDSQKIERDYILESHGMKYYDNEEDWFMDYPDDQETRRRFEDQGVLPLNEVKQAMENTDLLLEFEDFTKDNPVFSKQVKLPSLYDGNHTIDGKKLPKLTQKEKNKVYSTLITKLYREYIKNIPEEEREEYFEGVKKEVQTVIETGMTDYFLIDYELVKEAVKRGGVLTNSGRGSSVGYFTNTLLGFSKVDRFQSPIKLYPERFISKSRILDSNSLPDIDLNWGTPEIAEEAQKKILGENHAYPMIAFGTYKKKSAFKLYARAKNLDFDIANRISKQIDKYEEAVKHAEDDERDEINIYDFIDEEYHEYIAQSEVYWGIISDKKKAPCSYLLYAGDIREEIGLIKCKSESTKKEYMTTVIDGSVAENYKFLKNDHLKVDTVLLTDMVYKKIGIKPHTVSELAEAVENDNKVWKIYGEGLTIGVNQCEKDSTIQKLKQYKPQNISELSAFIAAIRPGFKSMYSKFASRESYEYGIKAFDDLIQTEQFPYSFIMYQEQLMSTLNFAGFPIDQCYQIIKDIAKKHPEKVRPLKGKFIKGFSERIRNNYESDSEAKEISERIWKIIDDSTSYSFNSAHAYCMALDSLYNAWQKVNYPYEFYEVLLQYFSQKGKKDKVRDLKQEMYKGWKIKEGEYKWGVDNRKFVADKEKHKMNPALVSIKGLSQGFANDLYRLSQKKKSYENFYDLWKEINSLKSSNAEKIRILINIGYFQDYANPRKLLKFIQYIDELKDRSQFNKNSEQVKNFKKIIVKFCDPEKETEKQYRGFDYEAALRWIWNNLKDEPQTMKEKIQAEVDYLGYVKTINEKIPMDYAVVVDIAGKYANKIVTLYRINDGSTEQMKVKGAKLKISPLEKGQIIKTLEMQMERKWRKGDDGEWHQIDEEEEILKRWVDVI